MLAVGKGPPAIAGVHVPSNQKAILRLLACANIIAAYNSAKLSRTAEIETAIASFVPLQFALSINLIPLGT